MFSSMFTNICTKEEFSIEQLDSNNSKYKLNINKYINKLLGFKSVSQIFMFVFLWIFQVKKNRINDKLINEKIMITFLTDLSFP